MSAEDSDRTSLVRNLVVAALVASAAAVLVNRYLVPRTAEWVSARVPVEQIVELDERRDRATREFVTSFVAGLIGPPAGEEVEREVRDPDPDNGPDPKAGTSGGTGRTGSEPSNERPRREEDSGPAVPDETPVYTIDRAELNDRLQNPARVRDRITIVSNREGPEGLRVRSLEGYYAEFGLRPGDVVLSVNDRAVPTRRVAVRNLMEMSGRTTFRLEVLRSGERFEIRYEVPTGS